VKEAVDILDLRKHTIYKKLQKGDTRKWKLKQVLNGNSIKLI